MKNKKFILICLLFLPVILVAAFVFLFRPSQNSIPLANRPVLQIPLTLDTPDNKKPPSIEANKLPEFVYDLTDHKFDQVISSTADVYNFVKATIAHTAYAKNNIDASISLDREKRKLIVSPRDIVNFIPGLYKLSLTLRTLEGDVNIDQDFTWGVIAVNTNKSIFKPNETAKIGIGVLDNAGRTLCMTGLDRVDDLSMIITNPQNNITSFSIKDKTILDSGKCGSSTVTNEADFQANYKTSLAGIYQITVTATVNGKQRQIEDYFKVDPNVSFDLERTSFPTRIYPPVPYPVTFTVTSANDYSGAIEDTVPYFFSIDHVSDKGKVEQGKDFTKIVWNVNLKAGVAKNFTYFIQFPNVSPEFYLIGPIKIGNFTEARQWQIASDQINSSTGVFTCEDNASANTWYRNWTGTAFSATASMSHTPQDSRWFHEVSSPITGEKLVLVIDNNNSTTTPPTTGGSTHIVIYIFRWSGSAWSADITMTMVRSQVAWTRFADIAYEQLSGDALFAYCDNELTSNENNIIKYIRRVSGTWSVSGTFTDTNTTASDTGTVTAPKAWIRLVSQSNSNNILMSYVNTSRYIGAQIWNGDTNSWGNELIDNSTYSPTQAAVYIQESSGSGYETNTGTPMVAWGNASSSITYRRLVNNIWTTEETAGLTGLNANAYWVNMASDDSSNNLALGIATSGGSTTTTYCYFGVWDGSSWSQPTSQTSIQCRYQTSNGSAGNDSTMNNRPINVAWEHGTSRAVWVYNTYAAPTYLSYRTWSSGTFVDGASTGGTAQTNPISIQMYSDPNTPMIIVIYSMGGATSGTIPVYDREWDGSNSTWTSTPGSSLYGNAQNGYEHAEAFGFGFDLNLERQSAYKFFHESILADPLNELTAQDTPYTLTSSSQAFRLRLILYYSDVLPISTGRRYDLQYVDPGSGTCASPSAGTPSTWTDVATTSGTLITYYDDTQLNAANITYRVGTDPTYSSYDVTAENYEEQNSFTNTQHDITGGYNALWDFSLQDKTTTSRTSQTFCFRVRRDNGTLIRIGKYPQISTYALSDVIIQGNGYIRGNTTLR
jgi:hypothetical protein